MTRDERRKKAAKEWVSENWGEREEWQFSEGYLAFLAGAKYAEPMWYGVWRTIKHLLNMGANDHD